MWLAGVKIKNCLSLSFLLVITVAVVTFSITLAFAGTRMFLLLPESLAFGKTGNDLWQLLSDIWFLYFFIKFESCFDFLCIVHVNRWSGFVADKNQTNNHVFYTKHLPSLLFVRCQSCMIMFKPQAPSSSHLCYYHLVLIQLLLLYYWQEDQGTYKCVACLVRLWFNPTQSIWTGLVRFCYDRTFIHLLFILIVLCTD